MFQNESNTHNCNKSLQCTCEHQQCLTATDQFQSTEGIIISVSNTYRNALTVLKAQPKVILLNHIQRVENLIVEFFSLGAFLQQMKKLMYVNWHACSIMCSRSMGMFHVYECMSTVGLQRNCVVQIFKLNLPWGIIWYFVRQHIPD